MEDNFNHRKWFKDQYLKEAQEANINEEMTPSEKAYKAILDVAANMKGKMDDHYIELLGKAHDSLRAEMDDLKRDAITNMMDRERSLREDDLDEIRYPQDDFTQSQLVPRMESMVDIETYRKFTDSLDSLLDDWYMEGFEKNDVLAFMKVIIPSS